MKLQSTTPASKIRFVTRACIVAATVLSLTAAPFAVQPALADQYDEQIAAIQRQIDSYNAQAGALRAHGDTLQAALDGITNDKARIQAQLDLSIAKENQLKEQIAANQKKLAQNKSVLGDTIADIFVEGNTSTLERLAGSDNIAEFVDTSANQDQVKQTVADTITKIKKIKAELEDQQKKVKAEVANQTGIRDALAAKEAEQAQLVAQTRGEQSAYEQLSAQSRAQQEKVRQQQQAAIAARFAGSGGATLVAGGAAGGYPWNASNCAMWGYYSTGGSDGNGGDGKGYGCRQCASYAAWRVAREIGMYPMYWGNATNFPASGRSAGFATGYTPRAGSLAVMHAAKSGGPEGHVGWVEEVYGNGDLLISQYNYNYGAGYGMYSKMRMSAAAWDEYVYIK